MRAIPCEQRPTGETDSLSLSSARENGTVDASPRGSGSERMDGWLDRQIDLIECIG